MKRETAMLSWCELQSIMVKVDNYMLGGDYNAGVVTSDLPSF